ncbi:MAG TPA: chemotaxis protein CheD [Anaerolineaceae bacterium]|nr:chemotaxis protein CheD [Anaerolineaceae bacterium]HPN52548.1 chemotaxis protein CheD [Anaerolineaceae bacterium]
MANHLAVGLGEIKVSRDLSDVLVAFGLGSCVGVGMYDPGTHVAGLLHAVLPINNDASEEFQAKYADTGIRLLLDMVLKAGAVRSRIVVKMAGGANMLTAPGFTNSFDIGSRNITSARNTLKELGFRLASEEVGGQTGRTVRLYVPDGRMTIRMMGGQEREF